MCVPVFIRRTSIGRTSSHTSTVYIFNHKYPTHSAHNNLGTLVIQFYSTTKFDTTFKKGAFNLGASSLPCRVARPHHHTYTYPISLEHPCLVISSHQNLFRGMDTISHSSIMIKADRHGLGKYASHQRKSIYGEGAGDEQRGSSESPNQGLRVR